MWIESLQEPVYFIPYKEHIKIVPYILTGEQKPLYLPQNSQIFIEIGEILRNENVLSQHIFGIPEFRIFRSFSQKRQISQTDFK